MKYLYLCLALSTLLSSPVFALTLEKVVALPEGVYSHKFEFSGSSAQLTNNSNYFHRGSADYRIGSLQVGAAQGEVKTLHLALTEIEKKIKWADDHLKESGSSFNQLAGAPGHLEVFKLDDYIIKPDSVLYSALEEKFNHLQKLNWQQQSGVNLSKDLSSITEYAKGKAVKTSAYQKEFLCKRSQLEASCILSNGGTLLVLQEKLK